MTARTAHDAAAHQAREMAEAAPDEELISMLRIFADEIESDGRARAPQWIREAANRLQSR